MSISLHHLLNATPVANTQADPDIQVESLSYDSRTVTPGSVFFALRGAKEDGSTFESQAIEKGAAAIVSESPSVQSQHISVRVNNARIAMADMATTFYGKPSQHMKVMGVTGTNGKTTTALLTKHLLDAAQRRCGLIGTIKYTIGSEDIVAPRTTPESIDLQNYLSQMVDAGSKAVAMEVSSHALMQHRVRGVEFDAAVFTNLTQDHLDYHKTMDAYFAAKSVLFENVIAQTSKKGRCIINTDDRYGRQLKERFGKKSNLITYGMGVSSDFRATDVKIDAQGSVFHLDAKGRTYLVRTPLIGAFNVYNSLAALAAASTMGMELRAAVAAMALAPQVPGRLERVFAKRNFQVFVDYAHTDDALRNVLKTLKDLGPNRLITVFGCGGDRDKAKRPLMAAAAEQFSDWSIITSDNPRTEDPQSILADIKKGMRGKRFEEFPDREEAIRRAVSLASDGDIVLIAGKGHETYQEFAGKKVPFDDVAVAKRAIEAKRIELEPDEPEDRFFD